MIIENKIVTFDGNESWLSNFSNVNIEFEGRTFSSVEHAYMSAKSNDEKWKQFCCDPFNSAAKVKKSSYNQVLVPNWDNIKKDIMYSLLVSKFHQEPFKTLLINTNNMYIQEGNTWGDMFWGCTIDGSKGNNVLGRMIMKIRDGLQNPLF